MSSSIQRQLSWIQGYIAESPWFAYPAIILLQAKVMLRIWEFRDLTPSDSSEYYTRVYTWLDKGTVDIVWSPIYTVFQGILHRLLHDPFLVLTVIQVSVAVCASVLVLALLRRLLPKYIAWIIAAWWALLPINFDTVYNIHLFSILFPLAIFVIAAYADNIYGRGIVLGGLLFTAVLVRNEYSALFILWMLAIGGYELYAYRTHKHSRSLRTYLAAYGLPLLAAFLIIGVFYAMSDPQYPELEKDIEAKHTLNVCQIYAYNRIQQGYSWQGDPWTECQDIMERDFGRADITFSQAFFKNPRAILDHIWWNVKLIPSGTQLALFNYYWGGSNPDYMTARKSPLVWLPFLLVLGLSGFGAMTYCIIPGLRKQHSFANGFAWLLLFSAALLVFGIMMMQRPRPSYMFLYSIFIMALTGLGLQQLLELLHINDTVKTWWPMAGILLILFVPSYYDTDYINDFGYKGLTLRNSYRLNVPYINRTTLVSPAVVVTPTANYTSLCNYLGIQCRTLDLEGDLSAGTITDLVFPNPDDSKGQNIYVLFLDDMIWKVAEMPSLENKKTMDYVELHCFSLKDNVMTCTDGTIDLNTGFMNDGTIDIPLRASLFVNDGFVINRKDYRTDKGYYLQVLERDHKAYMILVADDRLFRTNFNQQYLLGNYDRSYFEEVANNYPIARVLKVKSVEPQNPK